MWVGPVPSSGESPANAFYRFIPIAGDVILGMYKANSRNAALLEEFLRIRGEEFLKIEAARAEGELFPFLPSQMAHLCLRSWNYQTRSRT